MSKIIILKASPRKNGNSNALATAFAEEAKKAGAFITEYDVTNMQIGGCRSCYGCMTNGVCVFHDDFEKTMALMKAEIVGDVLIPKVSDVGEIKNTDGEEQARKLARKFS